jgi:hypothetical protein
MIDGKAMKEGEFVEKIVGTLWDYATSNQYSFGTLTAHLK